MTTQKMTPIILVFLACIGLLFAALSPVQAQTQGQMNQTAERNADKADAAMNVAYKKLMAVLDPAQKKQLVKAQRAWLAFRDAEATLLSSKVEGGSIYPMMYSTHIREITQKRTRELTESRYFFMTEGEM